MKRPSHGACSVCHSPLANLTLASHRHLPMRNANRESAAGALGLALPNSCSTWSMEWSSSGDMRFHFRFYTSVSCVCDTFFMMFDRVEVNFDLRSMLICR